MPQALYRHFFSHRRYPAELCGCTSGMSAAGRLSLCNEAKFKKSQSIRSVPKLCLYIPSKETSGGCRLFRTRFFIIICKLHTIAPHFAVLPVAQICRIFSHFMYRATIPTQSSGKLHALGVTFRYLYRHDLALSARASCYHCCHTMTAHPPPGSRSLRLCLHIFIFTALR